METVERDFAPKGVKFYYVYKALAHPEENGYVAPTTLKERLMHVAEAKKKIGTKFNWLCDSMNNDLKHMLGDRPNSEFLIGPDGKFITARLWSQPETLRSELEEIFGPVEKPTRISSLGMKPVQPPKTAPKGGVKRIELPGRMIPVKATSPKLVSFSGQTESNQATGRTKAEAGSQEHPNYVKLRAEVDSDYLAQNKGKLYLGLFLDPLYGVHWNNQVAPPRVAITCPNEVQVSCRLLQGPKVKKPADADPREFLLDIEGGSGQTLDVKVEYFACDDAETFCRAATQEFTVTLKRDRDGGSRRPPGGSHEMPKEMFSHMDANRDGKVTKSEVPQMLLDRWNMLDRNRDGAISREEIEQLERIMSPIQSFRSLFRRNRKP